MRVLILTNNDIGLYKFRRELLEELVRNNKVYICLPEGEFIPELKKIGCKFIECRLMDRRGTNPLTDLKLIKFYKQIIVKAKADIVLTYTIKPNAYGGMVCASLGVPYVANVTGLGTAIENGGLLQKISLILYKIGLRKAQKVFFQNIENRNFMVKHHIVKGAYDVLPGSGVNLAQYKLEDYPNKETIDFVFVARVMKEKGIEQYLDAAEYIRNKYLNTRFHICGFCEQNYKDRLAQLEKEGVIVYHGLVSNMVDIYKMCSCTVHPTYYPEGLSNVLLESAASARPIITTNRSGCREVVEDGVNGYVVRERDSQDLIEKIVKFIKLPWKEKKNMGLYGRQKVEREFDRKIVVKKYLLEIER